MIKIPSHEEFTPINALKELQCKARELGQYKTYAMPKIKKYYKLIKQYPDSGYELGQIVKGEDLSLSAVYDTEYWQPVNNKFTRDELIQIMKECVGEKVMDRQGVYYKFDRHFLDKLGITMEDFKK